MKDSLNDCPHPSLDHMKNGKPVAYIYQVQGIKHVCLRKEPDWFHFQIGKRLLFTEKCFD